MVVRSSPLMVKREWFLHYVWMDIQKKKRVTLFGYRLKIYIAIVHCPTVIASFLFLMHLVRL